MGKRRTDAVTIDVGAVQDPATTQSTGDEIATGNGDESPPRHGSMRWWTVGALVAAALVAAGVARVATDHDDEVIVSTLFLRDGVVAPDVPDRQVVRRWFHEFDADADVLGVGVTEDLVVAQVRDGATGAGSSNVHALAQADGETAWLRELSGDSGGGSTSQQAAPIVVVRASGSDEIVLVTDIPRGAVDTPGIVALDADDGTTTWRLPIQRPSIVEVLTARDRAVVHYVDAARPRTEVVDLASGRVVLADDTGLTPITGGWLRTDPEREDGWEILTEEGTVRATVTSTAAPVVRASPSGDVVITLAGTQLAATAIDGSQVWTATLPGTEPIPATEVDVDFAPIGDDMVLAGAYRASDNEVGRLEEYTPSLVTAGGVVAQLDNEVVAGLARQVGLTTILVDGRPLLACAVDAEAADTACPADLALVELDGTVVARVDGVTVEAELAAPLPHFGLATTSGLVVSEDDVLRLRRWSDLASTWAVTLPTGESDFLVTPTDGGLAIAHDGRQPGITWLS